MPREAAARADEPELRLGQVGDYWLSRRAGSPMWYKTWFDPATRQTARKSLRTSDFREAHAALVAEVAAKPVSDKKDPASVSLHDVFVWYYENHAKHLPSAGMARTSLGYWTQFYDGRAKVTDLTPLKQKEFRAFLESHVDWTPGYIGRIMAVGRAAVNWAHDNQIISYAPRIKTYETREMRESAGPKGRPLYIEEMARLFCAKPAFHVQAAMAIMINTLCRPGAARDLKKAQVDFHDGLVDLNPKGRIQTQKRRPIVPLTATLRATLLQIEERQIEAAKHQRRYDFKFEQYVLFRGQPVRRFHDGWRELVTRAGFDRQEETITPYSIRHTLSRELRRKGIETDLIAVYLGHLPQGPVNTHVYAPIGTEFLFEPARVIETYVETLRDEVIKQGGNASLL